MKLSSYYGYICPSCRISVTIGTGEHTCPNCGKEMIPDDNGQKVTLKAYCKKCKTLSYMISSDICPDCGTEYE